MKKRLGRKHIKRAVIAAAAVSFLVSSPVLAESDGGSGNGNGGGQQAAGGANGGGNGSGSGSGGAVVASGPGVY